jgi:hypothetical protein
MSNFEKLKRDGVIQRGRKPKTESTRNNEKYKIRAEARRRASLVLQHRYADEFEILFAEELASMSQSEEVSEKL